MGMSSDEAFANQLYGAPAPRMELMALEGIAYATVDQQPWYERFAYAREYDGTLFTLDFMREVADEPREGVAGKPADQLALMARAAICFGDIENPVFALCFNRENEALLDGQPVPLELITAHHEAEALLQTEFLGRAESAVLRHVLSVMEMLIQPEDIKAPTSHLVTNAVVTADQRRVVDVIVDLVDAHAEFGTLVRELVMPDERGNAAQVIQHKIVNHRNLDADQLPRYPMLQVSYTDDETGLRYYYTCTDEDGELVRRLETVRIEDDIEESGSWLEDDGDGDLFASDCDEEIEHIQALELIPRMKEVGLLQRALLDVFMTYTD